MSSDRKSGSIGSSKPTQSSCPWTSRQTSAKLRCFDGFSVPVNSSSSSNSWCSSFTLSFSSSVIMEVRELSVLVFDSTQLRHVLRDLVVNSETDFWYKNRIGFRVWDRNIAACGFGKGRSVLDKGIAIWDCLGKLKVVKNEEGLGIIFIEYEIGLCCSWLVLF